MTTAGHPWAAASSASKVAFRAGRLFMIRDLPRMVCTPMGRPPAASPAAIALVAALVGSLGASRGVSAAALRLHELSLDLPASPAAVVSTDLDGDGVRDLAILLVFTRWEQKMVSEKSEMDEVQGFVEVM